MSHITVPELTLWQRSGLPFKLIDVRRAMARDASGRAIEGADWLDPAAWLDWKDQTPEDRPVVLYCAYGHEIGQGLAATLCVMGRDARYLAGGFEGWQSAGCPTIELPVSEATP